MATPQNFSDEPLIGLPALARCCGVGAAAVRSRAAQIGITPTRLGNRREMFSISQAQQIFRQLSRKAA